MSDLHASLLGPTLQPAECAADCCDAAPEVPRTTTVRGYHRADSTGGEIQDEDDVTYPSREIPLGLRQCDDCVSVTMRRASLHLRDAVDGVVRQMPLREDWAYERYTVYLRTVRRPYLYHVRPFCTASPPAIYSLNSK